MSLRDSVRSILAVSFRSTFAAYLSSVVPEEERIEEEEVIRLTSNFEENLTLTREELSLSGSENLLIERDSPISIPRLVWNGIFRSSQPVATFTIELSSRPDRDRSANSTSPRTKG